MERLTRAKSRRGDAAPGIVLTARFGSSPTNERPAIELTSESADVGITAKLSTANRLTIVMAGFELDVSVADLSGEADPKMAAEALLKLDADKDGNVAGDELQGLTAGDVEMSDLDSDDDGQLSLDELRLALRGGECIVLPKCRRVAGKTRIRCSAGSIPIATAG